MAGFKYKKFSFTGGSAEFPSGTTASAIQTKERAIVKGFADALIAMNIGWGCDTTRNATTSDFVDVPKYSSSTPAPGLFLVNATSGCKLFIAYVDDGNSETCGMALYDTDGTTKLMPANDYVVCRYSSNSGFIDKPLSLTGFIMSIIPAGSTNSFGSTFKASEFLPADATRLWSSAANISYSYSSGPYILSRASNGNNVTVCVWGTPYCVGYGCGKSTIYSFEYCVGRIIGDLANPTIDITNQSKYGALTFYNSVSNSSRAEFLGLYSGWDLVAKQQKTNNNTNYYIFGDSLYGIGEITSEGISDTYGLAGFSVCKADGSWLSRSASYYIAPFCSVNTVLFSAIYDTTSNSRPWKPFGMYCISTDPQNDCIANGNGFKGYLDTDLFRCSPQFAAGTVMDNGNFICTGEACLTLGWDPSNESW